MPTPLSHRIQRRKTKLALFLAVVVLICLYYNHSSSDIVTPKTRTPSFVNTKEWDSPTKLVNAPQKPILEPAPIPPAAKSESIAEVHSTTAKLGSTIQSSKPPLPRLPPQKSPQPGQAQVQKKLPPKQLDDKDVFHKYSDDEYASMEIILATVGGTRLDGKGSMKLLDPVDPLPRKPKFPVDKIKPLPGPEAAKKIPRVQTERVNETPDQKKARLQRLNKVKETFLISWNQYKKYAWGRDEVRPVSNEGFDPFAGWAATLVDALDTLLIMGLEKEFQEALQVVKNIDFSVTFRHDIPLFETVIRYLGGLLAAYDLSREPILLKKAVQLGDNLMGAFDTPNHMPLVNYQWSREFQKYRFRASSQTSFAELGSLSVEFTRLAQLTHNHTYFDAVDRITTALYEAAPRTGIPYLFSPYLDASGCKLSTWLKQPSTNEGEEAETNKVPQHVEKTAPLKEKPIVILQAEDGNGETEEERQAKVLESAFGAANEDLMDLGPIDIDIEDTEHIEDIKDIGDPDEGSEAVLEGADFYPKAPDTIRENEEEENVEEREPLTDLETTIATSKLSKRSEDGQSKPKGYRPVIKAFGPSQSGILNCTDASSIYSLPSYVHRFTMGGLTDSAYEYYVKEYLLLNGADERYEELYTKMVEATNRHLIFRPLAEGDPDILMVGNAIKYSSSFVQKDNEVSHLACFIGGMYALGGKVFNRPEDIEMASKLTEGCVWAYNATRSGVMPESFNVRRCPTRLSTETEDPVCHFDFETVATEFKVREDLLAQDMKLTGEMADTERLSPSTSAFHPTEDLVEDGEGGYRWPVGRAYDMPRSFTRMDSRYLLLPEALESVFYMYRVTGDSVWQDRGWTMFSNILQLTQVVRDDNDSDEVSGFSAVGDVTDNTGTPNNLLDEAESFWMAETLKYVYLLFSEPDVISLDEYVFNTEAHPMRRPTAAGTK